MDIAATTGTKVRHITANTFGTVLAVRESTSPYNPGTWVHVEAEDGLRYWTPADSIEVA